LIEEIGRIYGYENIGEEAPKKEGEVKIHKKYYYSEKIRDFLTKKGFTEVYTYSLRDKGELKLKNPLASDKNFVRSTLMDGVENSIILNEKNKAVLGLEEVNIFEIGNVFVGGKEHTSVCIGMTEQVGGSLERVAELIFNELGIKLKDIDYKERVFEFNIDKVLESLPEPKEYDVKSEDKMFYYKPFSLFPAILRDIAVWVPDNFSSDQILSMITEEAGELLIQSDLFDEYKKDERISYAFKLVFQSDEKTLSDEEINETMKKITESLNSQEGFEVR
jgi:phenylalanyl-tRNA synthetase beta chain